MVLLCFTFTDNRAQQNNARFQQHNMWQQMYGQPPSASRQPESPVLGFQVRRTHLLEDAMSIARKLMVQNSHGSAGTNGPRIQDLKKPLKIKFHNEAGRLVPVEHSLFGKIKSLKGRSCRSLKSLFVFSVVYFWPGVDAGGVTKEFFQLLIEELFAKETGIQHIAAHFKHGFVSLVCWQRGHSFLLSLFPCFNPLRFVLRNTTRHAMVQNEKRQRRNLRLGGVVVGVGGLQRSGVGFAFSSVCKCVFV